MRSTCKPLLIVALAGAVIAVPALAQQSSSGYPAPCDASKVSKGDVDRAHTVFLSGKQFLEESNYDKAISYFKDAYTIDCSVHGILPIIAGAYERKGDKAETVRALEEYLRRAPNAPDREVIERRIKNLSDQLAREQPATSAAPAAPPTATASTPSATSTAEPIATTTMPATPAPASAGEGRADGAGGHSVAPWVLVGVGGAALIAGGVMLGVGSSDVSSAQDRCPTRKDCAKDVAAQGNNGRTLETAGVLVGILGIGATGLGLAWHFGEKSRTSTTAETQWIPVAGPQYAGLAARGSF